MHACVLIYYAEVSSEGIAHSLDHDGRIVGLLSRLEACR